MAFRVFLLLSLTALLIFSAVSPSFAATDVDDEDLSFLEDPKEEHDPTKPLASTESELDEFNEGEEEDPEMYEGDDEEEGEDLSDLGNPDSDPFPAPDVDEKDVVVVKERNFTDVIENNQYVMVEFYAPWCGHCQSLAPEYAAAATELKGDGVVLAKIDATEENELAHQYSVQGFPTILFFVDGEHKPYTGGRTKDTIVTWVKKKIGPSVYNLTTLDDAEKVLTSGNKVVLGYLNSLVGVEHDQLAAASKAEDDVNFYQTVNPDVAKLFHIDPQAKRPALVLVKREAEKISHFDGEFVKSDLASFVSANKLPLVSVFTRESAPEIFESAIKKQILLFVTQNGSEKVLPEFEEAAKSFKGKLIFVSVDLDNEDYGKPVAEYFGVSGNGPKLIAYTGNEDPKKHFFDGEIKSDKIKTFAEEFLSDKLKPFYKSDPIPEKNDGDVKIVVGDNFDDIVLDESKDVLLEVYAPWCGHCQALEPMYNKLAKHLREIDSLVIAKMDGTTNEHPKAKAEGFPTILFFPAGNTNMAVLCSSSTVILPSMKPSGSNRRSPFLGFSLTAISKPSARVGIYANTKRGLQVKCEAEQETTTSLVPANQRWMFDEEEANGPDIWNTTWYPKASDHVNTDKPWYVVDATDKILGRLASTIANHIRGKNLASYTPSVDMGAFVIVVNAEKVAVSGKKRNQKLYRRHSGRPGGMTVETFDQLQQRIPERIIEHAVRGMLPKGRLGRALFNHLKVYKGPDHPHEAQKPLDLPIRDKRIHLQK